MTAPAEAYLTFDHLVQNSTAKEGDLTITHEEHFVVQATDYGVWGDVIREQKSDVTSYRYGYQGQFAEKDDETGWNHFELREYDPVIGRWTAADPMRQYWSPYVGMGNSPVNGVDEDGAFFEELKNWVIGRGWVTNEAWRFTRDFPEMYSTKAVANNITEVSWQVWDDQSEGFRVESKLFASGGRNATYFFDAFVIEGKRSGAWGITLPPVIKVGRGQLNNTDLLYHEYGHVLQYRAMGAFNYYYKVGLPSLFNTMFGIIHNYHPVEIDANMRSSQMMGYAFQQAGEWPIGYTSMQIRQMKIGFILYNDGLRNISIPVPGRLGRIRQRHLNKLESLSGY